MTRRVLFGRTDESPSLISKKQLAWLALRPYTSQETVRQEMEAAGYHRIDDFDFLSKQHFQVFSPNTRE